MIKEIIVNYLLCCLDFTCEMSFSKSGQVQRGKYSQIQETTSCRDKPDKRTQLHNLKMPWSRTLAKCVKVYISVKEGDYSVEQLDMRRSYMTALLSAPQTVGKCKFKNVAWLVSCRIRCKMTRLFPSYIIHVF